MDPQRQIFQKACTTSSLISPLTFQFKDGDFERIIRVLKKTFGANLKILKF